MKKRIKILYRGPIYEKGGIYGPITTPYLEESRTISRLLMSGKKVNEVFEDGGELPLDLNNFNKDNSKIQPDSEVSKEIKSDSVDVESTKETIVNIVEEPVVEPTVSVEENKPEEVEVPVKTEVEVKEENKPEEVEVPVEICTPVETESPEVEEESDENGETENNKNNDHFKRMKRNKNR